MTMDILGRENYGQMCRHSCWFSRNWVIYQKCSFFPSFPGETTVLCSKRETTFQLSLTPGRFPVVILLLLLPQRKETQLQHWIQSKVKEDCKNPTLTQLWKGWGKHLVVYKKKKIWFSRKNAGFEPSHVLVIRGNTYQHRSESSSIHSCFPPSLSLPRPSAGPFYQTA